MGSRPNVRTLIEAIPGVEFLSPKHAMGPGIGCQSVAPMPMEDTETMFREAVDLKADYLVVPYHSCYRQHCKMQLAFGVEVHHYLSLIAKSIETTAPGSFASERMVMGQ